MQTTGRPGAKRTRPELPPARSRRRAGSAKPSPSPVRRVPGAFAARTACPRPQRARRRLAKRGGALPPELVRERSGGAAAAEGAQAQRVGSANLSSTTRCGRTALAERGAGVHVFPAQIINEPADADGRAAARAEDSLRALGSPLPASRGVHTGTPAPPADPLKAPAPRLQPAHRIAAVVGQLDKGGAQRRDARAQRRDERNTCPRGGEARQVPRAGLPRSTLRGSTPPGAPSPTGAYFGLRNRPGSAAGM